MANPAAAWFALADEDRDGAVGGAEAVRFFTRSGLPKDVLGQIWEVASGGAPGLNVAQFGVALRLVSLAQASGGRLVPEQARLIALGGGPLLPPPRLAGVTDAPPVPSIATYTPQITGLSASGPLSPGYGPPQPTGGVAPLPYGAAQRTGGGSMGGAPPYAQPPPYGAPQRTGGGSMGGAPLPVAGATGATAGGGLPGWPPPSAADLQRYTAAFMATDTDRDGYVKGSECFPVFMKSGLDKALLKRMWDLVAGASGSMSGPQFAVAMYLMDGCRRGAALPDALPPGDWLQVGLMGYGTAAAGATGAPAAAAAAGMTGASAAAAPLPPESWTLDSQFGPKGAVRAVSDAYDQTLPRIPGLPAKIVYEAPVPGTPAPSAVPDLDAAVASMLAPADKARWEAERESAMAKEEQHRKAEAEAAAAKARMEAFQVALSELVMFKSRVDVALLQAGDSAARLAAEAEDTELRYSRAHLAAQAKAEAGGAARAQLQALLARKQEAALKLELLEQELAMADSIGPAELAALEAEVGGLVASAAAAESKKAALDMQRDSGKRQRELLVGRIADLELAAAAGEGDVKRARAELAELEARVAAAAAAMLAPTDGGTGGGLGDVSSLLLTAASAYRRLYSSAAAAGVEVPFEAQLGNVGSLTWLEQIVAGTADWVWDDDAVSGYAVVNALPDLDGVHPALLRAAAAAAAEAPPVKPVLPPGTAEAEEAAGAEAAGTTDTATAEGREGPAGADDAPARAAAAVEAGEQEAPMEAAKELAASAAAAGAPSAASAASAAATTAAAAAAGVDAAEEVAGEADGAAPDEQSASAGAPVAAGTPEPALAIADEDGLPPQTSAPAVQQPSMAAGDEVTDALPGMQSEQHQEAEQQLEQPQEQQQLPALQEQQQEAEQQPTQQQLLDALPSSLTAADSSDLEQSASLPLQQASPGAPSSGLAGFDPALYRRPGAELDSRPSLDSSYAGSTAGGSAAAGATGASGAADDDALVGFEDNAF